MTTNTFAYNGLDTRVSKTDSGGTKTFKRDGVGVTAPVLNDGVANYTPGVSSKVGTNPSVYSGSGLKNADVQTDSGGMVSASRVYDAFGNAISSSGAWQGPFGYAGKFGYQEDNDTSLRLLGHRYYDSSTGRFLTRDPIKDGRNWYVYCESNPISFLDAEGLSKQWIGYGLALRISQMPPWLQNLTLKALGLKLSDIQRIIRAGNQVLSGSTGSAGPSMAQNLTPKARATYNAVTNYVKQSDYPSLPVKGVKPNSGVAVLDKGGSITKIRYYDGKGKAALDIDFTHLNHHGGFVHSHKWTWLGDKAKHGPGIPFKKSGLLMPGSINDLNPWEL